MKGASIFWTKENAEDIILLRAYYKSGHWQVLEKKPLSATMTSPLDSYSSEMLPLIDVHPDGFAQNLAVGILRGRFRDSELHPTPLQPGEVYEITVDLGPIAAQIGNGHRLRVDVCGAYFPLFDRNPNTAVGPFGMRSAVATEHVYHDQTRMSRILLPSRK
jgi:hypothetical protein